MKTCRVGAVVISVFVVVMVRPAASESCSDTERDERGKCPPKRSPLPVKHTEVDIQGAGIAGARVWLDGREMGLAPVILKVTPGRHHVELKKDKRYSKWVDVKQSERVTWNLQLTEVLPVPAQGNCPVGMMHVPAGKLERRDDEEVALAGYCIDKTEVTVRAYTACVAAKGCSVAPGTVTSSETSMYIPLKQESLFCNDDERPDHPINCVELTQAAAYCKWADKRLPTDDEWEYAARGSARRDYPWGNALPGALTVNACGTECVAMVKRVLDLSWPAIYKASDGWETTAPVGSFPADVSVFGVLDMAGNVQEWFTSTADGAHTRGGSWQTRSAKELQLWQWGLYVTEARLSNTGFRCVRAD